MTHPTPLLYVETHAQDQERSSPYVFQPSLRTANTLLACGNLVVRVMLVKDGISSAGTVKTPVGAWTITSYQKLADLTRTS